jgi:hypothetical protein
MKAGATLQQVRASMRHTKVTTTLRYGASAQAESAVRTLTTRLEEVQTDEED